MIKDKILLITNMEAYLTFDWTFYSDESHVLKLGQEQREAGSTVSREKHSMGWQFTYESNLNFHSLDFFLLLGNGGRMHSAYLVGLWETNEKVHCKQQGALQVHVSVASVSHGACQTAFLNLGFLSIWNWDGGKTIFPKGSFWNTFLQNSCCFHHQGNSVCWVYRLPQHSLIMKNIHGEWFQFSKLAFRKT